MKTKAQLMDIIERASVQFLREGSDGETAAKMLAILNEAACVGLDAESALHADTEKAYAEALASLANMREILTRFSPVTPATSEHLAEVRRFARLVKDVEGLL